MDDLKNELSVADAIIAAHHRVLSSALKMESARASIATGVAAMQESYLRLDRSKRALAAEKTLQPPEDTSVSSESA